MTPASSIPSRGRTDTASRVIDAPPELVFDAFSSPESLASWLPPRGATMRIDSFEPRPGGALLLVLTFAADVAGKSAPNTDVVKARFVAFDRPSQVVWDVGFESDRPEFAGTMRMTWDIADAAGGSEVRITAENVPSGITAEAHEQGLTSSLDNLARFLNR